MRTSGWLCRPADVGPDRAARLRLSSRFAAGGHCGTLCRSFDHSMNAFLERSQGFAELLCATWVAQRGSGQDRGRECFDLLANRFVQSVLAHGPGEILEPLG